MVVVVKTVPPSLFWWLVLMGLVYGMLKGWWLGLREKEKGFSVKLKA